MIINASSVHHHQKFVGVDIVKSPYADRKDVIIKFGDLEARNGAVSVTFTPFQIRTIEIEAAEDICQVHTRDNP